MVHICPKCNKRFKTNFNFERHINRKFSCMKGINDNTANSNTPTINNINFMNINIMTNEMFVKMMKSFVKETKFGKYNTLDKFLIDSDRISLNCTDVLQMTDNITRTNDTEYFSDAFYLYDPINHDFMMRSDKYEDDSYKHKWQWNKCEYEDIQEDIKKQLTDNVFIELERKFNKVYMIDGSNANQLTTLYKLMKFCEILPICKTALNDNQLVYISYEPEYHKCDTNDICKTLAQMYDDTLIRIEDYYQLRDLIKSTIKTNGTSTFNMIKVKISEFAKQKYDLDLIC